MTGSVPLERDCETTIIAAAQILGYRVHATRPARTQKGWRTPIRGDAGFPDLVIAGHGCVFFVELKRRGNKPTDDQLAWIATLRAAVMHARVWWVPEEQQELIDMLTCYAERRPA